MLGLKLDLLLLNDSGTSRKGANTHWLGNQVLLLLCLLFGQLRSELCLLLGELTLTHTSCVNGNLTWLCDCSSRGDSICCLVVGKYSGGRGGLNGCNSYRGLGLDSGRLMTNRLLLRRALVLAIGLSIALS